MATISTIDDPPTIHYRHAYPAEEQEAAYEISDVLQTMRMLIRNFETALRLFDEFNRAHYKWKALLSEDDPTRKNWQEFHHCIAVTNLAVRDAALTVWHVENSLDTLSSLLKACPTLAQHFPNKKPFAAAKGIFKQAFPDSEPMRTAVAHVVTAQRLNKGKIGSSSGLVMKNVGTGGDGRTLVTTFEGRQVSCTLSNESLATLVRVTQMIFTMFREAEEVNVARVLAADGGLPDL